MVRRLLVKRFDIDHCRQHAPVKIKLGVDLFRRLTNHFARQRRRIQVSLQMRSDRFLRRLIKGATIETGDAQTLMNVRSARTQRNIRQIQHQLERLSRLILFARYVGEPDRSSGRERRQLSG